MKSRLLWQGKPFHHSKTLRCITGCKTVLVPIVPLHKSLWTRVSNYGSCTVHSSSAADMFISAASIWLASRRFRWHGVMLASANKLLRAGFFCICEADSISGVPIPDLNSHVNSAMTTCKALRLGDWRGIAKGRGASWEFWELENRQAFKLNEQTDLAMLKYNLSWKHRGLLSSHPTSTLAKYGWQTSDLERVSGHGKILFDIYPCLGGTGILGQQASPSNLS